MWISTWYILLLHIHTIHIHMHVCTKIHPKSHVYVCLEHIATVDVVVYLSTDYHSSVMFIIVCVNGMFSDSL